MGYPPQNRCAGVCAWPVYFFYAVSGPHGDGRSRGIEPQDQYSNRSRYFAGQQSSDDVPDVLRFVQAGADVARHGTRSVQVRAVTRLGHAYLSDDMAAHDARLPAAGHGSGPCRICCRRRLMAILAARLQVAQAQRAQQLKLSPAQKGLCFRAQAPGPFVLRSNGHGSR